MPKRIQLSRKKGHRKPEGAVVVARPSKWANPIKWQKISFEDSPGMAKRLATEAYRDWLAEPEQAEVRASIREELKGKDLCCWCPPGDPCHADVLLGVANEPTVVPKSAPKAGTTLTRERMAGNLRNLNLPWQPQAAKPVRKPETELPLDEMRQLARIVWDDGSHGEPASTLASYVLALLGEPPWVRTESEPNDEEATDLVNEELHAMRRDGKAEKGE